MTLLGRVEAVHSAICSRETGHLAVRDDTLTSQTGCAKTSRRNLIILFYIIEVINFSFYKY